MFEMLDWIFYIFFALTFIIFFVWNKHNKKHLTIEEKKVAASLLAEAAGRELRYIWIIIPVILGIYGFLLFLERFFRLRNAADLMLVFVCLSLIYGSFRNRAIYRKANLPLNFANGNFALNIFIALAFLAISIFKFLN